MKKLLLLVLVAVWFAALPFPGRAAAPDEVARAKAALALAAAARQRQAAGKKDCGCWDVGSCTCPAGECGCAACANDPFRPAAADTYEVGLYDAAGAAVVCKTRLTLPPGASWPGAVDCCGKQFVLRGRRYCEQAPQSAFVPTPAQFFAPMPRVNPPLMFMGGGFGGGACRGGG